MEKHSGDNTSVIPSLLTVIVPCFNAEKTVAETLRSILASTYQPLEVIAVNDGSTDGTLEILEGFKDQVRVLTKKNDGFKGPGGAINLALTVADGEFIHCLDSDDCVMPDYHARAISELQKHPDATAVCANAIRFDLSGKLLGPFRLSNFTNEEMFHLEALIHNPVISSTVVARRNAYDRAGVRRPEYEICDDYELWLRFAELGAVIHLDIDGVFYRDAGEGISADLGLTRRMDTKIIDDYLGRHDLEYFFPLLEGVTAPEVSADGHGYIAEILVGRKMEDLAVRQAQKALEYMPDHHGAMEILCNINKRQQTKCLNLSNGRGKKRKILIVAHNFPPYSIAGSELYTLQLAQSLQREGADVQIVHPRKKQDNGTPDHPFEVYDGVPVHRLPSHFPHGAFFLFDSELTRALMELIGQFRPDVLNVQHLMNWPMDIIQSLKKTSIPVLLTLHDFHMMCTQIHLLKPDRRTICQGPERFDTCDECMKSIMSSDTPIDWDRIHGFLDTRLSYARKGYQAADRILALSEFLLERFEANGFNNPNTLLWRLGLHLFDRKPKTVSDGLVRFVFIGNLTRLKGVMDLVRSFGEISPDEAQLDIWGREFTLQLEPEFHSVASQMNNVHLRGAYKPGDLSDILAQGDVVVVPSHTENYPLVVREALHAGLPVIASRVGGVPEIIDDNVTGLLFTAGDVKDLTQKLRKIIDSPDVLRKLTANIRPVRSMTEDARDHLKLYDSLLAKSSGNHQVDQIIESATKLASRGLNHVAVKRVERALMEYPDDSRLTALIKDLTVVEMAT